MRNIFFLASFEQYDPYVSITYHQGYSLTCQQKLFFCKNRFTSHSTYCSGTESKKTIPGKTNRLLKHVMHTYWLIFHRAHPISGFRLPRIVSIETRRKLQCRIVRGIAMLILLMCIILKLIPNLYCYFIIIIIIIGFISKYHCQRHSLLITFNVIPSLLYAKYAN